MRARPVVIGRHRQHRHVGAKIRTADADVDHVCDLAALSRKGARPHVAGEIGHAVVGFAHGGHHVLAVHRDAAAQVAQGGVQHGPALGLVDLLAGEHRLAAGRHIGALG